MLPATRSHSTAWRRQAIWLRVLDKFPVTPRPQLHHRGVILDTDHLRRRRAQRRDGHRQRGPWGSFLLVDSVASSRTRAASFWLHIQDPARPRRPAAGQGHSPGRWRSRSPRFAPGTTAAHFKESLELLGAGRPRSSAQAPLAFVDRHRRVRSLMRVDADHHRHRMLLHRRVKYRTVVGMSDCSSVSRASTPLPSQTTARPDGRHLVRKPSRQLATGTRAREPCRQGLSTGRASRTAVVDTQSDGSGRGTALAAVSPTRGGYPHGPSPSCAEGSHAPGVRGHVRRSVSPRGSGPRLVRPAETL